MNAEQAKRFVGKRVALRCVDGFQYEGEVTRIALDDIAGMWLEIDGEWWVSVQHASAADWRQPDD